MTSYGLYVLWKWRKMSCRTCVSNGIVGHSICPYTSVQDNVLEFLVNTNDVYDLYNLDFYGGFVYPTAEGNSRCVDAIRSLIHQQSQRSHSFILIATFNVRDKGAKEILPVHRQRSGGFARLERYLRSAGEAHQQNQATRLKTVLSFSLLASRHVHMVSLCTLKYRQFIVASTTGTDREHHLVHFYAEFVKQPGALPDLTQADSLAEIINYPLRRMDGMIPRIEIYPPQVERPAT